MHANSETKKSVQQAKNTVKTNAKLMSAFAQQNIFRTKICEKLIYHNYEVIILDNLLSNTSKKVKNCKLIKADITNFKSLKKIKTQN